MFPKLKITLILLILVSVSFVYLFQPLSASAQTRSPNQEGTVTTRLIGTLNCTVGGVLARWLVNRIGEGLKKMLGNATISGIINRVPGLRAIFTAAAAKVPIEDQNNDMRRNVLNIAGRCFARELLNDTTARMIGAARTSGRDGGPSFVRDWRRFLANAQQRGENIFRSVLSGTALCNTFSAQLKTLFKANNQPPVPSNRVGSIRVGNLDPFSQRARCTMPRGWTLRNYTEDFGGNGSWQALNALAQPQNNFYGALMLSLGELAAQKIHEEKSDSQEAGPDGFTSRRAGSAPSSGRCVEVPVGETSLVCGFDESTIDPSRPCTNGDPGLDCFAGEQCFESSPTTERRCTNNNALCTNDSSCAVAGPQKNTCLVRSTNGSCVIYNDIITPGSTLANAVNATVQEELSWLVSIDEWQELIQYLMTTLMSRILNLAEPSNYHQEEFERERYSSPYDDDFDAGDGNEDGREDGENGTGTVTLFEDTNWGASAISEGFSQSDPDFGDNPIQRNEASSLRISGTVIPIVCADRDYNDDCTVFYSDDADFSNDLVGNDDAESIRIVNIPLDRVVLCPATNFIGTTGFLLNLPCESFTADDPDLTDNVIRNDAADSILIPTGWSATLYQDANYGGGSITLTRSAHSFAGMVINDGLSSIRIFQTVVTPTPTPTPLITECSNGIDDDGDTFIDLSDPQCNGIPTWNDEASMGTTQCSDGIDNDTCGDIDSADLDCTDSSDDDEGPICN